ncbi:MAG: hypothetical protein K6G80_09220 [Treponema sp.]|nr:hypothetical protein [Treponema sp.]
MANTISLNAYSYKNFVSGNGSKLHVPVNPASVIYAQFDHISGYSAGASQKGVPVSKIQILNSLINQLISMKSTPKAAAPQMDTGMSEHQMDALIKDYQGQIQASVQLAQTTGYGLAGVAPEAGTVLNIAV